VRVVLVLAYVVILDWIAQLISSVPSVQETAGSEKTFNESSVLSYYNLLFLMYTGDPEVLSFIAYHIVSYLLVWSLGSLLGLYPSMVVCLLMKYQLRFFIPAFIV
jgi:hypothetical protein